MSLVPAGHATVTDWLWLELATRVASTATRPGTAAAAGPTPISPAPPRPARPAAVSAAPRRIRMRVFRLGSMAVEDPLVSMSVLPVRQPGDDPAAVLPALSGD